jgi:hypothetical protein
MIFPSDGHLDSSSSILVKVPLHMIVYNFSSRTTIDGNIEAHTGPFIAVRFNLDELPFNLAPMLFSP